MGIKKVNKLYNIVVSSNIFHLQPELCKSVHKCNFGEFLNFRNFWTNDVTDDVIGVVGSIFWVILRVYIYDVIISKFHQNRSVNKKSTGGGQNHPPLGQPPNLKDVNIPRVNTTKDHNFIREEEDSFSWQKKCFGLPPFTGSDFLRNIWIYR